jgi:hypothetical protein
MRKFISILSAILGLAAYSAAARADIAVGAGVSTLGYGVHAATSMTDFVALRFNANFGEMDVPGAELLGDSFGGIDYDVDASFGTYGLLLDFHPMALSPIGAGFVLSGGVYYNKNEFDFAAYPAGGTNVGGGTIGAGEKLIGNMSFDTKWAPYLGLGYDGTFQGIVPVSFFLTGGVMFQGSPSVSLTSTDPGLSQSDLDAEAKQIEDDASSFEYYPVIAVGVTISF